MAKSLAIIITRPPFGAIHAAEAIRLANGAVSYGHEVEIILLGDGVYAAKKGQKAEGAGWTSLSPLLEKLASSGRAKVLVDNASASARGIGLNDLAVGAELMDSSGISSAIANAGRSTVF